MGHANSTDDANRTAGGTIPPSPTGPADESDIEMQREPAAVLPLADALASVVREFVLHVLCMSNTGSTLSTQA